MKNELPLISVLLPVYNAEKYIQKAIDSLTHQSYQNIEIFCIDDGSKDNSLAIIERLTKKDSRIKLFKNETNLGLIKTLNKAIGLANGKYLARMDADDVSLPNRLEKQMNYLNDFDLDLIDCNINLINEKNNEVFRTSFTPKTKNGLLFYSLMKTPLHHPTVFCKSFVLKENLYEFTSKNLHCEDYELWTRLLSNNYKIKKMPEKLYVQLVNAESVSNKYESVQKENFSKISYQYVCNFFNFNIEENSWKICINRFKTINPQQYKNSLKILNKLKKEFIQRVNAKPQEIKEIETIINQQSLDIQIQALKKTKSIYFVFKLLFSKSLYAEFTYFIKKF